MFCLCGTTLLRHMMCVYQSSVGKGNSYPFSNADEPFCLFPEVFHPVNPA